MDIWQKALDLAEKIHKVTGHFPQQERFELVSQMRRAAVSISSNIAEGLGRYTYADKRHRYVQARGELTELITQIHYSCRVGYLSKEDFNDLITKTDEVHKMLNALISKMSSYNPKTLLPKS
mgnify:FL=1